MKNFLCFLGLLMMETAMADAPIIFSANVRADDPTILDVVYLVRSAAPTVKVRALAFENGYRTFNNVVRAETFVDDPYGKPTAQNIGDAVVPNVEHRLAWKDKVGLIADLSKCKFEILTSEQGQLPMEVGTLPAADGKGALVVGCGTPRSEDMFTALLWYYAAREKDLVLNEGLLSTTNNAVLHDGSELVMTNCMDFKLNVIEYIYDKMGYGLLNGALYENAAKALHRRVTSEEVSIFGYRREGAPTSVSLGDKAYCVVDVSAGAKATNYPVSYLDNAPPAGWGDEYKTTKILLRRIEPGVLAMRNHPGDAAVRPTAITRPFYIGVFEITQKQYELVVGNNPSENKGDTRPVERISWEHTRGWPETYNWPTVTKVDPDSFAGRLQARTGLAFDLPTEAQWEYASRGCTTGDFNNGNDETLLGRFSLTCDDRRGGYSRHTTVGSYLPNLWGLYDMFGNVREWCLDWRGQIDTRTAVSDPVGPVSGKIFQRVELGGTWCLGKAYYVNRGHNQPTYSTDMDGFRIVRNPAAEK